MSGFRDEALFGAVLILIVMDNGLSLYLGFSVALGKAS